MQVPLCHKTWPSLRFRHCNSHFGHQPQFRSEMLLPRFGDDNFCKNSWHRYSICSSAPCWHRYSICSSSPSNIQFRSETLLLKCGEKKFSKKSWHRYKRIIFSILMSIGSEMLLLRFRENNFCKNNWHRYKMFIISIQFFSQTTQCVHSGFACTPLNCPMRRRTLSLPSNVCLHLTQCMRSSFA